LKSDREKSATGAIAAVPRFELPPTLQVCCAGFERCKPAPVNVYSDADVVRPRGSTRNVATATSLPANIADLDTVDVIFPRSKARVRAWACTPHEWIKVVL